MFSKEIRMQDSFRPSSGYPYNQGLYYETSDEKLMLPRPEKMNLPMIPTKSLVELNKELSNYCH